MKSFNKDQKRKVKTIHKMNYDVHPSNNLQDIRQGHWTGHADLDSMTHKSMSQG